MDPITIQELRDQIADLQKRGLTREGAIKSVTKALGARVILLEDGEEVAVGDVDFTMPEQEMDETDEDETKADESEEDEDDDTKSAGLSATVKAAVAEAMKSLKPKAEKPKAPIFNVNTNGKAGIPAWVKGRATRNFKGVKEIDGREVTAAERAYSFGMWALASVSKQMPHRFNFPKALAYVEEKGISTKLHSTGTNTLGGYTVPDEFGTDLIDLREEYGVVRSLFKSRPMASDTRTDPRRTSGLTAYFVAEGGAGTESNKGWDQVRLTAKDLMVISRYTAQLSEDSVLNIGDDLAGEIAYAFSNKEDDCGFNGDGTSTYGGIIGVRHILNNVSGSSDSAGLIGQASGNTWAALTLTDFEAVIGVLPQYAAVQGAPCWVASRAFFYNVMKRLEIAAGGVTASEVSAGGTSGTSPMFLGFPVKISQVFPTATAVATVSCAFGNFPLGASFGDRQQDAIAFSEHATIGGENVFERNEIAIRGTERFDINVHDVGSTSAAGPICGLKTGA
jgi:HK97 family phage major capsid protein